MNTAFRIIVCVLAIAFSYILSDVNAQAAGDPKEPALGENREDLTKTIPKALLDSINSDSLKNDSLDFKSSQLSDTLRRKSDIDTVISYQADSVSFKFNPRRTILKKNAQVSYKETSLKAHKIEIDWENNMLFAEGKLDTIKADSLVGSADSLVWTGLPELNDGSQIITGEDMAYNIKTKRGRVRRGETDYQDGFYYGTKIKRIDEGVYNIKSGRYTTCDLENPHYHFWANTMQLKIKDKVVAKPVVLYFRTVPVAIIPFAVFSARGGRQSGLIIPTYGETSGQGRHFRNLGYYWAPNDYFDIKATLDFYERYGILFRSDAYYAKRYLFNGGLSGSFINQQRNNKVERRWDLSINHSHTFSPTMSLRANGYFVSDDSYLRDVSQNRDDWLKRIVRSNATLSKRWQDSPYSGSINVNYEKNLTTGNASQSLPRISFSRSQQPLFPAPEGTDPDEAKWFNKLYFSYSGSGEIRKRVNVIKTEREEQSGDSTITVTDEDSDSRARGGVRHNLTFSAAPDPLYYFNITPSVSYEEIWYDEWYFYSKKEDGSIDSVKHDGIPDGLRAIRTFSGRISLNTKLYGLFKPKLFSIEAIRHTLSPSLSMTYQPDFSEAKWGYYDVFYDSAGKEKLYDKFAGGIYGGAPRSERQALGISLNNLFEYKQVIGDEEKKGEIFNVRMNTSHNFAADSLKWSNLRSTFKLPTLGAGLDFGRKVSKFSGLNLSFNSEHNFYALGTDPATGSKTIIDKFADSGLRLVDFDLMCSFSLTGGETEVSQDIGNRQMKTIGDTLDQKANLPTVGDADRLKDRFGHDEWEPSPFPWKSSFSLRYGENRNNPDNVRKNIWGTANLEIQATKNWKISYDTRFDLHNRKIVSNSITIYRDMHCWEGYLSWNPTGLGKGFFLKINIKSPHLQDVKVEKSKGGSAFLGY